jgi:2-oxoglutarate ferredoxin oxidoreductase subunit alpha
VTEALDRLAEQGLHADYLRVRAFPFADAVTEFIDSHDTVFVVEQNRDAQLRSLLMIETGASAERLVPLLHYNGMPIPSSCVVDAVAEYLSKEAAA